MGSYLNWLPVIQGSQEWLDLRIGKVTGSNFGIFMANDGKDFGPPAKKYALGIALERITGVSNESGYTNEHMNRGIEQEPIARSLYEDEKFVTVTNGGFFDCGLYSTSPDGLIGNDGVIEIKSVIASTHYATLKRDTFDPAYRWQLAGHLDCTGREWVDFVSYCSEFPENKQLLIYRITRLDMINEITRLRERREEFLALVDDIIGELLDNEKESKLIVKSINKPFVPSQNYEGF